MTDVVLPDSAWEDVEPDTEALVDEWLVREGERVAAGQVLARVMLVKTSLEVTAPVDGVVERILVPTEQTFAKGRPLATLRAA
ncbi:MAG: lipoyl domain-containing protein [Burkholderiales bacterium]|nr:lipoyl domain-containing protein [Burkholderiales bacterium]